MAERRDNRAEITDIACADGFCVIHLRKCMMNREVGFGRRLLEILEAEQLSFEHAPSGIDSLSVVLEGAALPAEKERHVLNRIHTELSPDHVVVERDLSLITLVGQNVRCAVGLAARACDALAQAGVNIELIDHGACETSLMFGVREIDRRRAVQALDRALLETDKPQ